MLFLLFSLQKVYTIIWQVFSLPKSLFISESDLRKLLSDFRKLLSEITFQIRQVTVRIKKSYFLYLEGNLQKRLRKTFMCDMAF